MRRAGARHGGGRKASHRVGRRGFAVIGDDRRGIVVVAEVEARAAILLHVEIVGRSRKRSARRVAARRVILDLRGHAAALRHHLHRMIHGKARHLVGDGLALRLIGIKDRSRRPSVQMRRQLPAEIDGISNARIHAVARIGHPQMRGVAADEDPAVAEAIGHQPAPDPVLLAEDFVLEPLVDAEDGTDRPVAIDRVELRLVGPQMIMDQPAVVAVDRNGGAGTSRVEREHHPGRLVRAHQLLQLRRLDEGRLHALDHRRAGQAGADRFADEGAAAVAADHEVGFDAERVSTVEVATQRDHTIVVLLDIGDFRARQNGDARLSGGVAEQDRLEIDLVDPVRRLGRRPPGVGAAGGAVAARARGNVDTAELDAGRRGPIGAIVREVRGQARVAQLCGDAQPAEDFHRSRRDVIAFDAGRIAGVADLRDDDVDPARGQIHGRGQSHGPGAHDQHLCPHARFHPLASSRIRCPRSMHFIARPLMR